MLRADCRESISQAVSGIRDIPSLEGRSKAAIAQAVVLRLLARRRVGRLRSFAGDAGIHHW